ncbi:conserved hypothetical membrane protein [Formosa agariphila KMM 3901]|uniref:Conserved hypothetical membrane protein n=1 Tax=Formosa agariphila (strain DSM 15362 / KCTC 12365 / LMG 23005 / KMM 3901 / M-2Alg 35-1) TaxID=1347342 RepID=T2KKQ6_FORAG|nr:hypothetical protein [Formosa agariphila]CDF79315.1 conserved hypothetical membrane protein [Formosa agariphila KMM 3901]
MEETIKILIYIHAFLGGIGLITGVWSVLVKKGSLMHKKMGKIFSIGMIGSTLISIPISWLPNHENLFLFLIGLFTIYLVLAGNRALTFKTKDKADWIDKLISGSMCFFSFVMISIGTYGLIRGNSLSVLYLFFGGFGLLLSIKDFIFYNTPKRFKQAWLISHIGKMIGALIASITAFIIAGLGIGHIIAWTVPTILGSIYIIYWKRKVRSKRVVKRTLN